MLRIQYLEEKADEAHHVLGANINVLSAMQQYYNSTFNDEKFPKHIKDSCEKGLARFLRRLEFIVEDMKMQQSQLSLLLRHLRNRKSLVNSSPATKEQLQ